MRKVSFLMGLIAILPFIVVADHEPVPGTTDFDLYTDSHLQWLDDRCADPAELDPNAANTLAAFCIARESAVRKALHDSGATSGGNAALKVFDANGQEIGQYLGQVSNASYIYITLPGYEGPLSVKHTAPNISVTTATDFINNQITFSLENCSAPSYLLNETGRTFPSHVILNGNVYVQDTANATLETSIFLGGSISNSGCANTNFTTNSSRTTRKVPLTNAGAVPWAEPFHFRVK